MGAARIYTAPVPFNASEMADVSYEQSADVVYMAHWNHDVGKLLRYDHADWRWSDLTFGPDLAAPTGLAVVVTDAEHDSGNWNPTEHRYKIAAVSDATDQESLPSAEVVAAENDLSYNENFNDLSWDALVGANRYVLYRAVNGVFGYIGSTSELTFTDDDILPDLSSTPQEQRNPFATDDDRPGTVFFWEQRLGFARTRNKPNGVWLSQSAAFENMNISRPQRASDAITFAVVGRQVNFIQSLVPSKDLIALTAGAVYQINGGNEGKLTPTNVTIASPSFRPMSKVRALTIDDQIFALQAGAAAIRSLGFTFETEGYRGDNLSIYARHLFKNFTIVDWTYTEQPNPCFWLVRNDGVLLCLTFIREQMMVGYSVIETDGVFESVCAVPEAGEDKLYAVVRREIDGEQKRYVERMATTEWEDQVDAIYLDASVTIEAPEGEQYRYVSGLHHLEGREVVALVDGDVVRGKTVVDGQVDLGLRFTTAHIGLPYRQLVETLPLQGNGQAGSVQGRKQQLKAVTLSLIDSRAVMAGTDEAHLYVIKMREDELYGEATELRTGLFEVATEAAWRPNQTATIVQEDPLPFTLAGVFTDININE